MALTADRRSNPDHGSTLRRETHSPRSWWPSCSPPCTCGALRQISRQFELWSKNLSAPPFARTRAYAPGGAFPGDTPYDWTTVTAVTFAAWAHPIMSSKWRDHRGFAIGVGATGFRLPRRAALRWAGVGQGRCRSRRCIEREVSGQLDAEAVTVLAPRPLETI